MLEILSAILDSVPGAPGVPMPPLYSGAGSLTAGPSCSLDAPPWSGDGSGAGAAGSGSGAAGSGAGAGGTGAGAGGTGAGAGGTGLPPAQAAPFFGAKGNDYWTVRVLKRMGDSYKQDRSIGKALALLVVLPVMAPLVMLEDTIRNPLPGVHSRPGPSGCPHG